MLRFDRWREELRFAFVLPVHLRKPPVGAKFSLNEFFGSGAYTRGAEVCLGLERVSDGYSRLHFFKDRDGDLPISTSWGLLFDREQGFRRDPKDGEGKQSCKDKVHALLSDQPGLTIHELVLHTGNGERTVRQALKDLGAEEMGRTSEGDIRWRLPGESDALECS